MEKIILVRHTEAEGGDNVFRGVTDMGLTPEGLEHAKRVGQEMKTLRIDKIYSSMLSRAFRTAEEIAKPHKLRVVKTPKLNEINFGIFDGLQKEEVLKKHADIYEARGRDMMNHRIPGGGENYADVRARALPFILGEAKKNPGKTLVFVAHRGLMVSILTILLKDKTLEEARKLIGYGGRIFLVHDKGKLRFEKAEND